MLGNLCRTVPTSRGGMPKNSCLLTNCACGPRRFTPSRTCFAPKRRYRCPLRLVASILMRSAIGHNPPTVYDPMPVPSPLQENHAPSLDALHNSGSVHTTRDPDIVRGRARTLRRAASATSTGCPRAVLRNAATASSEMGARGARPRISLLRNWSYAPRRRRPAERNANLAPVYLNRVFFPPRLRGRRVAGSCAHTTSSRHRRRRNISRDGLPGRLRASLYGHHVAAHAVRPLVRARTTCRTLTSTAGRRP